MIARRLKLVANFEGANQFITHLLSIHSIKLTLIMHGSSSLIHRTIYHHAPTASLSIQGGSSNSSQEWLLPLVPSLQQYHQKEGYFHLLENPAVSKRAAIMGMFVIRSAIESYKAPLPRSEGVCGEEEMINRSPLDNDAYMKSMYELRDWIYSVDGAEGGGLISGFSALDAYRLALHYGISDAIIFGTHHVAHEGISDDRHGTEGYLWLADTVCAWDSLRAADGDLAAKIYEQRVQYQQIGLLSARKYPAQIAFTWTAAVHEGCEVR